MTTHTTPRRRHRHELTERQRSAFSPPAYLTQAAQEEAWSQYESIRDTLTAKGPSGSVIRALTNAMAEQEREDAVALADMDAITAGEATAANGWHVGADDDGKPF